MMNPSLKSDEGILIHSEKGYMGGRRVDIFTPYHGRRIFYASKNVINKYGAGGLLPFSYLRFSFSVQDDVSVIKQYESRRIFHMMDLSYEDMNSWYYLIDVVQQFFPLESEEREVFSILWKALLLASIKNHRIIVLITILQLLRQAGFLGNEVEDTLTDKGKELFQACLTYSWQGDFPVVIKKEVCRELIDFIERKIAVDCGVTLKTVGLFTI